MELELDFDFSKLSIEDAVMTSMFIAQGTTASVTFVFNCFRIANDICDSLNEDAEMVLRRAYYANDVPAYVFMANVTRAYIKAFVSHFKITEAEMKENSWYQSNAIDIMVSTDVVGEDYAFDDDDTEIVFSITDEGVEVIQEEVAGFDEDKTLSLSQFDESIDLDLSIWEKAFDDMEDEDGPESI